MFSPIGPGSIYPQQNQLPMECLISIYCPNSIETKHDIINILLRHSKPLLSLSMVRNLNWFKVDGELIANHFGITTQKLITGFSLTVGPSKTGSSGPKGSLPSPGIPKQLQICLNYNHNHCANPCTARHHHVCAICANQHPA